ncbi:hypothetical protein ACTWPT_48885 [Nonomuraea sp. 3N208]|uniref:hypothetical protein n=1 Tax=Nonomuraea sp. 3N208 TaxID=3457421 RepID=UPI003FD321B2
MRNIFLVVALVLAGVGVFTPAASADPCCPPCYGNTNGLFITEKDNDGNYIWAEVLNCGPRRKVSLDVSLTPDPPCEYIDRRKKKKIAAYTHLGGKIRDAYYC